MSATNQEYDPLKPDAYAEHLSKVNETKEVVATEDITNAQGAVVIAKGAVLDAAATEKILRFKLLQPLHDTVAIDGEVDDKQLYEQIAAFVNKHDVLKSIHTKFGLDPIIRAQCHYYNQFSLLRQKLTVLSIQMTSTYDSSLMSAWFCMLIGFKMQLSDSDLNALFLAALTHDLGMLHISPEILEKQGELSAEEWRQIHAHVVIGQQILKHVEGLPSATCRAVLEHHERCDGTGYPFERPEGQLSLLGQVVAMADSVIAVYFKRLLNQGKTLRDVIPIIQVNNEAHFYKTYDALVTTLRRSNLSDKSNINDSQMSAFIEALLADNNFFSRQLLYVEELVGSMDERSSEPKLHAIQSVFRHMIKFIRGSGVLDVGYVRWLEQVDKEKLAFAYREAEDVALMLEELQYHMRRLTRMLSIYADKYCQEEALKESVLETLEQLEELKAEATEE